MENADLIFLPFFISWLIVYQTNTFLWTSRWTWPNNRSQESPKLWSLPQWSWLNRGNRYHPLPLLHHLHPHHYVLWSKKRPSSKDFGQLLREMDLWVSSSFPPFGSSLTPVSCIFFDSIVTLIYLFLILTSCPCNCSFDTKSRDSFSWFRREYN